MTIQLVIFDLGGTVVDHGCQAPVVAFVEAFREFGMEITAEQARGPMGLAKLDHIRELFKLPTVTQKWQASRGRAWNEDDVVAAYHRFLPLQTTIAARHTDIVPGLIECVEALRRANIALAATTGYPREVTRPILEALAAAGFAPAASVCSDEVPSGRPAPFMIQRIMETLQVPSSTAVVKVGDTVPDIEAARNAGVWAVGITESGSEFGLTREELAALPAAERAARHEAAASKLADAGAHVVIKSLSQLPPLIEAGFP